MNLIGRKTEIEILDRLSKSDRPELLVLYGRRRIGKTFLIRQHFKGQITFDFVGSNKESSAIQLANFNRAFEDQCTDTYGWANNWSEAFNNLAKYIKAQPYDKGKVIIFFDEFPWMDKPKSGFLSAFEYFWNQYGSAFPNLLFIVCGSVSSWILKNLLKNYGGLHNRVTQTLSILPFTLLEVEEFMRAKNLKFTRSQIARIYLALGGVPYYLDMIPSSMSVTQVFDSLFFDKNALLRKEFNNLYASLFKNPSNYIAVIRVWIVCK
ncbi:MAG TPA: ATP-binding protein [Saprospiraceae bacterium]|nr:ATP-binding protein [Saprospiraceae bacterium]